MHSTLAVLLISMTPPTHTRTQTLIHMHMHTDTHTNIYREGKTQSEMEIYSTFKQKSFIHIQDSYCLISDYSDVCIVTNGRSSFATDNSLRAWCHLIKVMPYWNSLGVQDRSKENFLWQCLSGQSGWVMEFLLGNQYSNSFITQGDQFINMDKVIGWLAGWLVSWLITCLLREWQKYIQIHTWNKVKRNLSCKLSPFLCN